jgi:hypothetical protein
MSNDERLGYLAIFALVFFGVQYATYAILLPNAKTHTVAGFFKGWGLGWAVALGLVILLEGLWPTADPTSWRLRGAVLLSAYMASWACWAKSGGIKGQQRGA